MGEADAKALLRLEGRVRTVSGNPDSERVAMIYQHAVRGADDTIATAINHLVEAERDGGDDDGSAEVPAPAS